MGIMNIPYNQQTDPKALFTQGFENMVGGLMRGRQTRNLAGLIEDNPNATPMQMAGLLLSKGFEPRIAMGMGGLQQRMQPNIGAQPWASTQMTPAQKKNWLENYGRGVTIQTGQKRLTEDERDARAKAEHDKAMGKTGPGFGPGDKKAIGEEMDTALNNAGKSRLGPNYKDEDLFREWQNLIAKNTFDNDNQRENTWAAWKQKVNARKKGWRNWVGGEVDWDPTDPKWREAIGLGGQMKFSDVPEPKTKDEFINKIRELEKTNHELGAEYYNKYLDKFW